VRERRIMCALRLAAVFSPMAWWMLSLGNQGPECMYSGGNASVMCFPLIGCCPARPAGVDGPGVLAYLLKKLGGGVVPGASGIGTVAGARLIFWLSRQTAATFLTGGFDSIVNVTEMTHLIGTMAAVQCV